MLVLVSKSTFAAFRLPGAIQRYQIGYSFISTSADYKGKFTVFDSKSFKDTAVYRTGNVKTSVAWGISTGTYIPLTHMGNNSALVLDVNFMYNFFLWKGIGEGIYGTTVGWDFSGATIQMGLPIGLDIKTGSDATLNRHQRFCYTVGAGVQPVYNFTAFEEGAGIQFKASPYLKAEVGVFAGICMKARLTYTMGKTSYISQTNGFGGMYDNLLSDFTLTGKSSMMATLVIMPFSWAWKDTGWWNKSNTSTKMYKGWKARHKNYY